MALINFHDVTVSFGDAPVLGTASFSVFAGERVCLLGRNGAGKSTVLRLIGGELKPDAGQIERVPNLRVAKLDQELDAGFSGTVFDLVAQGLGEESARLTEYHAAANDIARNPDDLEFQKRLETAHHALELDGGWAIEQRIESVLDRLGVDPDARFEALSGGNKRRALLARALVSEPDILLLDEPTNHLDIPAILWLEEFLLKQSRALVFVTHDRAFLKRLSTRIVDIDRGTLTSWDCGYERYLEQKEAALENEQANNAAFDKKLAQEEAWIRRGIEARRTRNEGRVRALQALRLQRARRRDLERGASFAMQGSSQSGQKVIETKDISFDYDGRWLIKNFTTTIWRGDRIGIVGKNGTGKTTLLKLLLKELKPASGIVEHGTQLKIAYFDQTRSSLDDSLTLWENIAGDGDTVSFNGKSRHVISYLNEFLFSPQDARAPIKRLSGGERARAVLAKLFLTPANLWVLDEPTNDLDVDTCELLENLLLKFDGTVLVVSHDRDFLKNVVNATFALDGQGNVRDCAECIEDAWQPEQTVQELLAQTKAVCPPQQPCRRKLSNNQRRDLEQLPKQIEEMEAEREALFIQMSDPELYRAGASAHETNEELRALETKIAQAYEKWNALEELAAQIEQQRKEDA